MEPSASSSKPESTTGKSSTCPIYTGLARTVRNETDYDDWEYGTEPIPGDTAWVAPSNVLHVYSRLIQRFEEAETVSYPQLAALALSEILTLPSETLLRLSKAVPPLVQ
jgi:hypothetical protein